MFRKVDFKIRQFRLTYLHGCTLKHPCLQLNYTLFACLDYWHRLTAIPMAQWFLRRCLKSVDDGQPTEKGAYLCYKLTDEPG